MVSVSISRFLANLEKVKEELEKTKKERDRKWKNSRKSEIDRGRSKEGVL